jgi:hypothetical protein
VAHCTSSREQRQRHGSTHGSSAGAYQVSFRVWGRAFDALLTYSQLPLSGRDPHQAPMRYLQQVSRQRVPPAMLRPGYLRDL